MHQAELHYLNSLHIFANLVDSEFQKCYKIYDNESQISRKTDFQGYSMW